MNSIGEFLAFIIAFVIMITLSGVFIGTVWGISSVVMKWIIG